MIDIEKLRFEVKKLISEKTVNYVIGYEKGTYGLRVSPSFAYIETDVHKFIFNEFCIHNLSTYIGLERALDKKEKKYKIGLLVKGCDCRAITQYIQEKGIAREDLILIGVQCSGIIDIRKIDKNIAVCNNIELKSEGNQYIFKSNEEKEFAYLKDDIIFDKCKSCQYPTPLDYDIFIEEIGEPIVEKKQENYKSVEEIEQKNVYEKRVFWEKQFEKCIRCYACRNVCPLCYCDNCALQSLKPQWLNRSVNISENTMYHLIRAFHLAGRCIGCCECERVCPMQIPLMKLNKKLEKDVKELFGYITGIDKNAKPLFGTYSLEDKAEFIL